MLYNFFERQFKYPNKDDWILPVKDDLDEFGLPRSLEFLGSKSIYSFKRLVKIKTKEYALNHLLNLKSEHSKLDNLDFLLKYCPNH